MPDDGRNRLEAELQDGEDWPGAHGGLRNVAMRFRLLFSGGFDMGIEARPEGGVTACLRFRQVDMPFDADGQSCTLKNL
ncbi:MAG: hypothetical protein LBS11_00645 [Oscillospiraceae bacterium]|nr:hypothetical protein [Oscillospiraceae bacterium]